MSWRQRLYLPSQLSQRQEGFLTAVVALLAALLRFPDLGHSLHSDSLLWVPRIERFWQALAQGNFAETYQAPHPGVPVMWLSGISLKLHGQLGVALSEATLIAAKIPVALSGCLMAALTLPLLTRVLGRGAWLPALLGALMLATEPFLVEQARMLHLDSLAIALMWIGLLVALMATQRDSWRAALGAGALIATSCLTKLSMAPIAATSMALIAVSPVVTGARWWSGLRIASIVTAGALMCAFVIWPALWFNPVGTMTRVVEDAGSISKKGGKDAEFYASFFVSATPWHSAFCALLGAGFLAFRKRQRWPYLVLCLSVLPYLIIILATPKKLTRYVLPFFPVLATLGGLGLAALLDKLRDRRNVWLAAVSLAAMLMVGRFVQVARSLPSASICTPWPNLPCPTSAPDMYYMREIALAIREDLARVGATERVRVYTSAKAKLMAPWLSVKQVEKAGRANYFVLKSSDYTDANLGKLPRRLEKRLIDHLGPRIAEVRDRGALVARIYRRKHRSVAAEPR